jgi:hypothetical protein
MMVRDPDDDDAQREADPDPDRDEGDDGDEEGDSDEVRAGEVECPYCGEPGEIAADFDPDEPGEQVFVQDCAVCCHPWTVTVRVGHDGQVQYDVGRG